MALSYSQSVSETPVHPTTLTASTTVSVGKEYRIDSTGGGFTIQLPDITSSDDFVRLVDVTGTFQTNNCSVDAHASDTIEGVSNILLQNNHIVVELRADATLNKWIVSADRQLNTEPLEDLLGENLASNNGDVTNLSLTLVDIQARYKYLRFIGVADRSGSPFSFDILLRVDQLINSRRFFCETGGSTFVQMQFNTGVVASITDQSAGANPVSYKVLGVKDQFRTLDPNNVKLSLTGITNNQTLSWDAANSQFTPTAFVKKNVVVDTNVSGSYTIDWDLADFFEITVTGNATLQFSNVAVGRDVKILLKQDATGGHTVTLPTTNVLTGFGSAFAVPTGANNDILIEYSTFGDASAIRAVLVGQEFS